MKRDADVLFCFDFALIRLFTDVQFLKGVDADLRLKPIISWSRDELLDSASKII